MKTIDITKIIQDHNLNAKELAASLFPLHRFPDMALTRIIQGKGVLDANQISLLAELTGQSVNALFNQAEWVASSRDGLMFFESADFKAELDMQHGTSKIFHKGSIFHETILHSTSIPLSDYLAEVSAAVLKFKSKKLIK